MQELIANFGYHLLIPLYSLHSKAAKLEYCSNVAELLGKEIKLVGEDTNLPLLGKMEDFNALHEDSLIWYRILHDWNHSTIDEKKKETNDCKHESKECNIENPRPTKKKRIERELEVDMRIGKEYDKVKTRLRRRASWKRAIQEKSIKIGDLDPNKYPNLSGSLTRNGFTHVASGDVYSSTQVPLSKK